MKGLSLDGKRKEQQAQRMRVRLVMTDVVEADPTGRVPFGAKQMNADFVAPLEGQFAFNLLDQLRLFTYLGCVAYRFSCSSQHGILHCPIFYTGARNGKDVLPIYRHCRSTRFISCE